MSISDALIKACGSILHTDLSRDLDADNHGTDNGQREHAGTCITSLITSGRNASYLTSRNLNAVESVFRRMRIRTHNRLKPCS